MWMVQRRRIELQEPPRAPRREEGEWTPQDIGTDAEHTFVSPYRCPIMSARMFDPDPLVARLRHFEYWPENFVAAGRSGIQRI